MAKIDGIHVLRLETRIRHGVRRDLDDHAFDIFALMPAKRHMGPADNTSGHETFSLIFYANFMRLNKTLPIFPIRICKACPGTSMLPCRT